MATDGYIKFERQISWADEDNPDVTRLPYTSIIQAEKSTDMDFTQTPYGNDDMFHSCFDDIRGEEDRGMEHDRRKTMRTYPSSTNRWVSDTDRITRQYNAAETGRLYDPLFLSWSDRPRRSFQSKLFSRFSRPSGWWQQRETQKYEKWSFTHDSGFTSLSHIYPTRWVSSVPRVSLCFYSFACPTEVRDRTTVVGGNMRAHLDLLDRNFEQPRIYVKEVEF